MFIVRYLPPGLLPSLLLLALLSGCSSDSYRPSSSSGAVLSLGNQAVEDLLQEADLSPPPQKQQLMVAAAEQLWQREQYDKAISLLMNTDASVLNGRHLAIYSLLYGRWTVDKAQWVLAESILDTEQLGDTLVQLEPQLALLLHQLRREYFESRQLYVAAVKEQQAVSSLSTESYQQTEAHQKLWQLLNQVPEAQLITLQNSSQRQLAAWCELALIAQSGTVDLDQQVALLDDWLQRWPQHPAAAQLPHQLQVMQQAIHQRPQRVTLLLPLSGSLRNAGEALRDGFMAAYYQSLGNGKALPEIQVLDTESGHDFDALYDQAAANSDLIIGPLNKEQVKRLAERWTLPVATLALNTTDDTLRPPGNLYQFGLNPEDEARQAANLIHQQQLKSALIIAPENQWGQRISDTFSETWQAQGNTVSAQVLFDQSTGNYSQVLQDALGISDSKNRYSRIRQLSKDKIEFEPRRRQDVDVIYLAARPQQARQIKPLLAFHYAGQIPVYAASAVYSGSDEPEKNTDLDGVMFNAMPWLFTRSHLKDTLDNTLNPNPNLQTLYAMGTDSWHLYDRLPILAASPESRLNGSTGMLQLDEQRRVTRQQLWAIMKQGQVKILPSMMF